MLLVGREFLLAVLKLTYYFPVYYLFPEMSYFFVNVGASIS